MTKPTPGLNAFLNGHPFEFLHLVESTGDGDLWMVKPIFVSDQTVRTEMYRRGDRLTPVHSQGNV